MSHHITQLVPFLLLYELVTQHAASQCLSSCTVFTAHTFSFRWDWASGCHYRSTLPDDITLRAIIWRLGLHGSKVSGDQCQPQRWVRPGIFSSALAPDSAVAAHRPQTVLLKRSLVLLTWECPHAETPIPPALTPACCLVLSLPTRLNKQKLQGFISNFVFAHTFLLSYIISASECTFHNSD